MKIKISKITTATIDKKGNVEFHCNPCKICGWKGSYKCEDCTGETYYDTHIDTLKNIINKYERR